MRKRVEIHDKGTATRSTSGADTTTFSKVTDGDRWASIEPLSGTEQNISGQAQGRVTHRIGMRRPATVTVVPEMKIVYGSRTFNINAVVNVMERDRELDLLCVEEV